MPPLRVTRRLGTLFRIHPGEGEHVLLMLLFSVAAVGGIVITGQLIARSMFLSALPASAIPLRIILPPLATGAAVAVLTRVAQRRAHAAVAQVVFAGLLACVIAARIVMATPLGGTRGFLLGSLLLFDVAGALAMILFWTTAGDLFDPRQAKRLFGLISGGSTIANVAFGAVLTRVATDVRPENLVFGVMAGLLSCQAIAARLARGTTARRDPAGPAAPAGGLRAILDSPLLLTLAAVVVVVALAGSIADYQLDLALKARYGSDAQGMLGFLAFFRLIAGLVAAAMQFLVVGWVMVRFGILPALLLLPVAVGLGGVATLLSAGALWAVAIPRGAEVALKYTVNDSAFNLLFLPLPSRLRAQAKTIVEGLIKPSLVALLGLLFLVVARAGGVPLLAWSVVLLAVVAAWIVLLVRASRGYVTALTQSLTMRRLDLGRAHLDLADETSARVFTAALQDPDPLRVLHTLALIRGGSERDWSDDVGPLADHADPVVRTGALAYLGERRAARHRDRVRSRLDDPVDTVAAAAIEAHCAIHGSKAVRDVAPRLTDASLMTRGAAIVGLIRHGGLGGFLHAGGPLHELLTGDDVDGRKRGAELLGELAVEGFYAPLIELMDDPDMRVRRAAVDAAARVGAPDLVPRLLQELREPLLRRPAAAAIAACLARDPAATGSLVADATLPREARIALCGALTGRGAAALPALGRLVGLEDDGVRAAVYAALLRLRDVGHAPGIDSAALEARLRAELEAALRRDTLRRDLEAGGVTQPLLLETLARAQRADEDRVLAVLALLHPGLPLARLRDSLAHSDARTRAYAVELIDNVATASKDVLIPYIGGSASGRDDAARRLGVERRPARDHLERLSDDPDPWLRACARAAARPAPEEATPMALATLEKVLILKKVPIFREVPPDEVAALLPIVEEVSFPPGTVILRQGDPADALYVVVEGHVGVAIDGNDLGKRLGSGEVIGELGILSGDPRAATCTALDEVLTLRIHREPFWHLMRERPEVPIGVIKILLGYLRK